MKTKVIMENASTEPTWLIEKRKVAAALFDELPRPQLKYGISIAFNISTLEFLPQTKQQYKPIKVEKEGHLFIEQLHNALHDNRFAQLLKEHLFTTIPLTTSTNNYLEDNLAKWTKINTMHTAYAKRGVLVYVPKGISGTAKLDITSMDQTEHTHIIIILDENANLELTIVDLNEQNKDIDAANRIQSQFIEAFVDKNAHLRLIKVQQQTNTTNTFEQNNARIKDNASITIVGTSLGNKFLKAHNNIELKGDGAQAIINGVFLGDEKEQLDLSAHIIHFAKHTHSNITAKGVVKDKAKALYRGIVDIKENAKYSQGYQKEDAIILNSGAQADAIPKLLIENNEVKCSHGTTIGQVDKEKLFYMMSRGVDEKTAKHMIVEGFFTPILEEVSDEELVQSLKQTIHTKVTS